MKRTTLILDEQLLDKARGYAKTKGQTLTQTIHELLVRGLNSVQTKKPKAFKIPIFQNRGV